LNAWKAELCLKAQLFACLENMGDI